MVRNPNSHGLGQRPPIPASMGEFFAVLLARDLADGEKAIIGTNSDIQVAACNLARRLHAPTLWWVSGPGGMVNVDSGVIRSTADHRNIAEAEAVLELAMMVDFIDWRIHFFDFAILSVLQIDRFGNINTTCVGSHSRPKLRGPGVVGISALTGLSKRFYVVLTRHHRSAFVERVDFRAGAGYLEGSDSRRRFGLPSGGPKLVVTPLGVFDFEPESKRMRIASLHPGVALEDVIKNTGFGLLHDTVPPQTQSPTEHELTVLREQVDTTGVLANNYPWPAAAQ